MSNKIGVIKAIKAAIYHLFIPSGRIPPREQSNKINIEGDIRLLRKLSIIFHLDNLFNLFFFSMKGKSCQSPLTHLWSLLELAINVDGYPSISSISVSKAVLANEPSNKSWLRTWFSSICPCSASVNTSTSYIALPVKIPSPKRSWYTSDIANVYLSIPVSPENTLE